MAPLSQSCRSGLWALMTQVGVFFCQYPIYPIWIQVTDVNLRPLSGKVFPGLALGVLPPWVGQKTKQLSQKTSSWLDASPPRYWCGSQDHCPDCPPLRLALAVPCEKIPVGSSADFSGFHIVAGIHVGKFEVPGHKVEILGLFSPITL